MKKIFLALAAVAALASCVKENAPVLDQDNDNLVTITALATKTTLDGTSVVWDADDEIGVVYDINLDEIPVFSTTGSGSSVKFTGAHPDGYMETTSAYAVYPSSSVKLDGGVVKVSHNLPEVQTGDVTPGMILSSALLDAEDLKAGNATAQFHNALALVKVIVPAGVRSVDLASDNDALVGSLTFYKPNAEGILKRAENGTKRTVTLSTGSELAVGTHNLLVYPGTAHTLTLTMEGTDGAVYTSSVPEISFNAGEYRTIDLTKIFKVATEDLHVVLPAGGTIEVPVMTTDAYEYQVSMSAGADAWISYELPTKGFHKETITFTVAENTTGADREATVTITWADSKTKTFTIQQKNVYMDFVNDSNGDPIQWEETFGVYATEEDATAVHTYKNVFTIELSDDFSKGTYKVKNIFVYNNQYTGNVAGTYYANYEDGTFTIIKNDSDSAYPFTNNTVALTYNEVEKVFTASSPIQFGYKYNATYLKSGGFIKEYTAAVKVDDPGAGGDEGSISGDWSQTVTFGSSSVVKTGASASVTVSVSGDQVTLENFVFSGCTATGTLSEKTITISAANADLPTTYGPVDNDIVITLSDDMKTMTASNITTGTGYGIVVDSWTAELP